MDGENNLIDDVSRKRQKATLKIGNEDLKLIHKKWEELNKDMPTKIKLYYDV